MPVGTCPVVGESAAAVDARGEDGGGTRTGAGVDPGGAGEGEGARTRMAQRARAWRGFHAGKVSGAWTGIVAELFFFFLYVCAFSLWAFFFSFFFFFLEIGLVVHPSIPRGNLTHVL